MDKRFEIEKYGTVEINFMASTYTGQIEAQTPVKEGIEELENGMILFIDRINNEITFEEKSDPYLHFSTVRYYDTGSRGANHFVFKVNEETRELPRLYKLSEGDMFHTDVMKFATSEFADNDALKAALANSKRIYAYVDGTDGVLKATATQDKTANCEFVIQLSTMPNDQDGFCVLVNRIGAVATGATTRSTKPSM